MYKKDMIWVATATLIYPQTSPTHLVTEENIVREIARLFQDTITPVMLRQHLVSWEKRQQNPNYPPAGGIRDRYLFRTEDGLIPSGRGDYRLYKQIDSQYDGPDKRGPIHPDPNEVQQPYQYLLDWYKSTYF